MPKSRPSLDQVLLRANAVGASYVRGRVEGGVTFSEGTSKRRWTALGKRLKTWAESFPGLTPKERSLHRRPLGAWPERAVTDSGWALEALGVLLWAMRFRPLSGWDRTYAPEILPWIDVPSWYNEDGPRTAGRPEPRLRPAAMLDELLDRAEAWHWRAVTAARSSARTAKLVADAARAAQARGWLKVRGGDFPFRGKPYRELGEDAKATAWSIAVERHRAAAWLVSEGVRWDRVEIDT